MLLEELLILQVWMPADPAFTVMSAHQRVARQVRPHSPTPEEEFDQLGDSGWDSDQFADDRRRCRSQSPGGRPF